MKNLAKLSLGALVVASAATFAAATPASAQVSFGIGVGTPGYYPPYRYSYSCDPYSRWYDPYRCDYYGPYPRYYGPAYYPRPYYYGPSFVIGGNFGGHYGYRGNYRGGDRGRHR